MNKPDRDREIFEHYQQWCARLGIQPTADQQHYERVSIGITTYPAYMPGRRGAFSTSGGES